MVTLERAAFQDAKRVNEWAGLSTDTKPTSGTVGYQLKQGDIFIEIDTGDMYRYNPTADTWVKDAGTEVTLGRFLSLWNATTGLPTTNPTSLPYTYKTGDYYRVGGIAGSYTHTISMSGTDEEGDAFSVQFSFRNSASAPYSTVAALSAALEAAGHSLHSGTCPATGSAGEWNIGYVASDAGVNILLQDNTTSAKGTVLNGSTGITLNDTVSGGTVNYKPDGTTYTGAASTTVETSSVKVGDVYWFDGNVWQLSPAATETVNYTPQTLTSAQKSQARTNIGAQANADTTTVSIAVADWAGGTSCTKSVSGVTSSNVVVCDSSDATVQCTAQGAGTLTFTASTTPTAVVTVKVVIL